MNMLLVCVCGAHAYACLYQYIDMYSLCKIYLYRLMIKLPKFVDKIKRYNINHLFHDKKNSYIIYYK
jgi:hypothetical protein